MLQHSATIQQIKQAIEKAKMILVITHQNPDGDGLGALSAMAQYLKSLNKDYQLFCVDEAPKQYQFLPLMHELTTDIEIFKRKFDLVAVLDSGDLAYAGVADYISKSKKYTLINIDHHPTNNSFGDINLVLPDKSSVSEIIYQLFRLWQVPINKEMATALLNGIIFDTGAFSNAATSLSALEAASHLLNLGARHREINENTLRNKSLGLLKLWGKAFERLTFYPKDNLAITEISQKDFKECGVPTEAGNGLSNFFNELAGAKITMVLIEQEDGTTKGSLRTTYDDVDVSKLAQKWGGGGHRKAAGFLVKGKLVYNEGSWMIVD